MKKICQIAIIFMLLLPAVSQLGSLGLAASIGTLNPGEDEIDPSYTKVDFEIKEVVIYPENIVLFRREATVNSGSKFYTEFEGNSFPGCVRIIEDGAVVKDITIKNSFRIINPSSTDVFSITKLLKDNKGTVIELITSTAFYRGELHAVVSNYIFLKDAKVSRLFGDTIEQRNASFICLKMNDIENIILTEEPVLPEEDVSEDVKSDNSPKTRITWEDTGGGSRKVTLLYIVSGVSWKSEYFLDTFTPFEDAEADNSRLEHWGILTNNLGIDLKEVNVRLVAGDIKLNNPSSSTNRGLYAMSAAQVYLDGYVGSYSGSSTPPTPSSFTMQEFEVYTLPYKITLKKGETKQIQIQTCNVEIVEEYVYDATHFKPGRNTYSTWDDEANGKVQKILKVKNNGKTWPAGIVNVYQDYMLTGQDGIQWTPKGREAKVTIGIASDIEVKKKATSVRINPDDRYNKDYDYTVTIQLKNYKDKEVTVKIFDNFVSDALDLKSKPDFQERPGNQMSWEITLGAGAEKEIVYTYKTKS